MLEQTSNYKLNLNKTGEKVERFLDELNIIVFFVDEGRFGIRSTLTRIWAKKGEPLNVKIKQSYQSVYMYSTVSTHGGDDFSLILPQVNTEFDTLGQLMESVINVYPKFSPKKFASLCTCSYL